MSEMNQENAVARIPDLRRRSSVDMSAVRMAAELEASTSRAGDTAAHERSPSYERNRRRPCSSPAALAVAAIGFAIVVVAGTLAARSAPSSREGPPESRRPHFRRRLARSAADAFDAWTPARAARALPLDLRLDAATGGAYAAGAGGYLAPYGDTLAAGGRGEYWSSMRRVDAAVGAGKTRREDAHVRTPRRSGSWTKRSGRREAVFHGRALREGSTFHLDSLDFGAAREQEEELGEEEEEGGEEEEEEEHGDEEFARIDEERVLRGRPRDQPLMTAYKIKERKNNKKKKKLPQIKNLAPSKNSIIRGTQTFSAHVYPSEITEAAISEVSFRLEDELGDRSGWMSVPKVGDYYEITMQGFAAYPGSRWKCEMRAKDAEGRKKSAAVKVRVAAAPGSVQENGAMATTPAPAPRAPSLPAETPPGPSPLTSFLPRTHVSDSNWPHKGAIQAATGRIMFEFDDGPNQAFVCSGTVVMDGRNSRTPDGANGRTIIATAAHCAYNDVLKRFASRAIFIPDQVSTRGTKSNFDCGDDLYGCWYLSFAVVAKGWAEESFPNNVPFDYAYYTVFDDRSTHRGGYRRQGLTGVLDRDVVPMALDFDADPRGKFIFSIGYSADKDPDLRHCSMTNTEKYGLATYANLWLDDCAMTGGASGGPWLVDVDRGGTGTLVSVNSWGFTDRAGMAGPVLRTEEGSWAECLYDVAKSALDPGEEGGIIVNHC